MAAMFRYSPVATYSVSLPPLKLEFSNPVKGEYLKRDFEKVCCFMSLIQLKPNSIL